MQWILPKGYSFWRYKNSGYCPNNYWLILSAVVVIVCIGTVFNIELEKEAKEFVLFSAYFAICFLFLPFSYWFGSMYLPGKVTIGTTSVICGKSKEADFYLNEIENISFERVQWRNFDFYNCYVKLKPMRASQKDFYQFGIDIDFYELNKNQIIESLKFRASAQEYLSAPASD